MSASTVAQLNAGEETFRQVFDAAPDAMVVTRRDGRITLVNAQTEILFGYHRSELLGKKLELLIPRRARRRNEKSRPALPQKELYGRRKDGSEFPIEVSQSLLETTRGTRISTIRDITERKHADDLSAYLAAIVEASDDAIIGKSLDGNIVSWNAGAERLYGYKAEEVIGHPVALLIPRERYPEFGAMVKELRRGKHIENHETTRRHRDGHAIDVSLTISPVRDKAGAVIGASAIARDITAHKRADALISHLAAIVEASDDAIIGESLDGKITSWNLGAERIFGFKAEEVIGQPLSQWLTRVQTQQMAGIIKALRHGEHVEQIEATQLHKDGHALEMSLTVSPVKDKAGKVIGASLIGRDITRRRRAEEALRQSEERFRVALQNAPVAVFNQDRKLRYTWVNSPTLAWAKQDCIGHTDEEIIGGKEGALLTEIKQEVLTSGRGSRTETQVTFEGEIYYFDMVVEPLRDARGNLLGITCTATDITSTKRSLLEREQLVAKLQEALDEVNMLSGMLSICASCKRITNERGEWERLESYLQTHSEAKFSHGVCPDCMRKLYPDYYPAEQENEFQR